MKNLYAIILLAFLGLSANVNAQIVNIPDASFKAALIANGVNDSAGYITVDTAKAFKGPLIMTNGNIADLTGIEAFTALTYLVCDTENLTSLDVSSNIALAHLDCNSNNIATLNLPPSTALTYLDCSFNYSLSSLNLALNTALDTLICNDGNYASLDVSLNTALTYFFCGDNYFTSLDLSHNAALATLNADDGVLTSLDLSHNTALSYLDCGYNSLTSLDLSSNAALTYIVCSGNLLTSLNILPCHSTLKHLECYYHANLTSLDVSTCTALTYLDCDNTGISVLNLGSSAALDTFFCNVCNLTSLDLSANAALLLVICSENNIASLDLSHNHLLSKVFCDDNSLTTLNMQNGNNYNIGNFEFDSRSNPSLTCIQVDSVTYSNVNWTLKDAWASYSNHCIPPCSAEFTIAADTTQPHHYIITSLASGVPPLYYIWSWGDGTHDTIPYPNHIYADSGFYNICLTITDSTGCTSAHCDSSFHAMRNNNYMVYITVTNPILTGTKEVNSQTPDINIYPNPATTQLTIETNGQRPASIKLYNAIGQLLNSQSPAGDRVIMDMRNELPGVYFIQITDAHKNIVNKKIIKE